MFYRFSQVGKAMLLLHYYIVYFVYNQIDFTFLEVSKLLFGFQGMLSRKEWKLPEMYKKVIASSNDLAITRSYIYYAVCIIHVCFIKMFEMLVNVEKHR